MITARRHCRVCAEILTSDNPRAAYCGSSCRTRRYYARRSEALADLGRILAELRELAPSAATLALLDEADASLRRAGAGPRHPETRKGR